MKICNNCGAKMAKDSQYCTVCGSLFQVAQAIPQTELPIPEDQMPEPENFDVPVAKKKPAKKKIIGILCLVVFLLGLGTCGYFLAQWYFSPEQKALRLLEAGKYEEALELVDEEALDRDDEFEETVLTHLDEIKENFTQGKVEYATVNAELNAIEKMGIQKVNKELPELRSYVEELNSSRTCFSAAEKLYEDGKYGEALALYRRVIKTDSNYDTTKSRITECAEKYRAAALDEAAKYAEGGSFSNAVAVLEAALEILPGDADITSQKLVYEKDNLEQIKADAMDEAAAYAASKDYVNAMTVLNKYVAEYGNDSEVSVKYNEYQEAYVDTVLTEVDGHQNQDDYTAAIKTLNAGLTVVKDNTRLKNRLEAVTKAYTEKVCADADKLVSQKKFDEAIDAVEQALSVVPGNTTLTGKKTEIEEKSPKCFVDMCKPYESRRYEEFANGRTFDMAGQQYTNGIKMECDGYAIWNINGNYTSLEFDLGHIDGTNMSSVTVELYLDEKLYKTIEVKPESLPQHYSISLEGARQLKIKALYANFYYPTIGMGNMIVQ